MKKVLLTESEYRKVCKVLNESPMVDLSDEEYEQLLKNRMDSSKVIEVDESITWKNYSKYVGRTLNVKGNVYLDELGLKSLPIKFIEVTGDFNCGFNNLTSLEGAPSKVGRNFVCSYNNLTSLEGCPKEVGGDFRCGTNRLTSLEGCPKEVGGDFWCTYNKLTNLKGAPRKVSGDFYCEGNQLEDIECDTEIGGKFLN